MAELILRWPTMGRILRQCCCKFQPLRFLPPASVLGASHWDNQRTARRIALPTNTGSASLNVASISVQGDFAQDNTCNTTIQAGHNCEISVTFTPTVTGTRSGVVTIADNAVNSPQKVSLSGSGTIATTTTLSSSLNPSSYGKPVTFTAAVSSVVARPRARFSS